MLVLSFSFGMYFIWNVFAYGSPIQGWSSVIVTLSFIGVLSSASSALSAPIWGRRSTTRRGTNLISTVCDDQFVTPCVAGRKLIVVSETGEVMPCEVLDKSIGDLREVDFDIHRLLASDRKPGPYGGLSIRNATCTK